MTDPDAPAARRIDPSGRRAIETQLAGVDSLVRAVASRPPG